MNNYITLDGYQYKTKHGEWLPLLNKAGTARMTAAGSLDVTYGPGSITGYEGVIMCPNDATAPWGDITNLLATLAKVVGVTIVDHFSTSSTVHCIGEVKKASHSPMWDGDSNEWDVGVRLLVE